MNTVSSFVTKFARLIVCTLHCFDRVIFKGHLALAAPAELERFVDQAEFATDLLFRSPDAKPASRQSAAVGRLIQRRHARHLVA